MAIPYRHKTVSTILWWYHGDTGIILAMTLDVLSIQNNTKFVRCCKVYCSSRETTRKTGWESLQGANQGSLTEGLSTVDLLVLTSLDQLLSIMKILFTFLQTKLSLWGQFCWAFSIHYVLPGYSGAHWVNILRGRLTTVGLLIKLARFRKKLKVF